jgi:hypothetical protein
VSARLEEVRRAVDLNIKYTPGYEWQNLEFEIDLGRALTADGAEQFESLLRAWYDVGAWGGYGGSLHNMSDGPYLGTARAAGRWQVDMGTAPREALDVLLRALTTLLTTYAVPTADLDIL